MRRALLATVLAVLLAPAAIAPGTPLRVETKPYVNVLNGLSYYDYQGLGGPFICDAAGVGLSVGGACFDLSGTETRIEVDVVDAVNGPLAGEVWFIDAAGDIIDFTGYPVCPSHREEPIPAGAVQVVVHILSSIPECPTNPFPSDQGSVGYVRIAFHA